MKIKARPTWSILEYQREEDYVPTKAGLLIATSRNRRSMVKGTKHTLSGDPDVELPDVVRCGTIIASNELKAGTRVLFNKHDGWGFLFDDQYLYAIPDSKIMATLE